jgi:hypothetical protein
LAGVLATQEAPHRDELIGIDWQDAVTRRVAGAIALRCDDGTLPQPPAEQLKRTIRGAAARHLVLRECMMELSAALAEADIAWLPIKGCDLAHRVYDDPTERPVRDLDVLIAAESLAEARRRLELLGWESLYSGPRAERFLREEGYAWQATRDGNLLELHFRLWGWVPADLGEAVLREAPAAPEAGATARSARLEHAYLIAAVHTWQDASPRPLTGLVDLDRIAAAGSEVAAGTVDAALAFDLALPVGLAARFANALWPRPAHAAIADELLSRLDRREHRAAGRALASELDAVRLSELVLARLLSGRRSRLGWKSVARRAWAHPGVVEIETDERRPWPARRLRHVLGLGR